MSEPLLSCHGIDMAYGPVQILFGVDFDVVEGEMVALLGTNGAGKSTLLKGICGLVRPTGGTVTFKGEDITKTTADVTARKGISLMPGGLGQVVYGVRDRLLRVIADRRGILVPSLVADKRVSGEAEHAADEESLLTGALSGPPDGNGAGSDVPVEVLR